MSSGESDGIGEALDEVLRAGLLLGTRVAERHLRERERELRDAASRSLQQARGVQERQHQARRRAVASLAGVQSDSWWQHASAPDIRQAWITAREYQQEDAAAARAVWTIADQLALRYGLHVHTIDPAAFGTQPRLTARSTLTDQELRDHDRHLRRELATLASTYGTADPPTREGLDQRMREVDELRGVIRDELAVRDHHAGTGAKAGEERREAQTAVIAAGADDRRGYAYDSAERRARLADRLSDLGVPAEAVEATVLADTGQAHPPEQATAADGPPSTDPPAATRRPRARQRKRAR